MVRFILALVSHLHTILEMVALPTTKHNCITDVHLVHAMVNQLDLQFQGSISIDLLTATFEFH